MADLERSAESFESEHSDAGQGQLRGVPKVHDHGAYERFVKPVVDRVSGVLLTVVTFPIVVVVGVAVAVSMGRPVLFRQRRVGRFGDEFMVVKFRTMGPDRRMGTDRRMASSISVDEDGRVEGERRANHKSSDDPRHTDVGRFLRKWSLDEIPQFWNVAAGDMSLVGPRPELVSIVDRYEPWQHRRHEVKPGLTGLWQVSARGSGPMHEATDIDVAYVDDVTFVNDIKILLQTPAAALGTQQGH
ncbi:MAG: sugar transferase [Acidimicrobiia bacterium]